MAWIKMRVLLDRDPKVMAIARYLSASDEFQSWIFDGPSNNARVTKTVTVAVTIDALRKIWGQANECAKSDGVDVVMSHTTLADLDAICGVPGIGLAMQTVDWARVEGKDVRLPNFLKGNTLEEERALTNAERQKRYRDRHKENDNHPENGVTKRNGHSVTTVTNREGEGEGEGEAPLPIPIERNGEKKSKGDRKTDRPIGRSAPTDQSPIDALDLEGIDWQTVLAMALAVGKRIPPKTAEDRRAWLRYAVLAEKVLGEWWLVDSAEAVCQSKHPRNNRRAHFVAVLKSKAAEQGIDAETLHGMARRVEIPDNIWKSEVLKIA